jgi:hypothetical protein
MSDPDDSPFAGLEDLLAEVQLRHFEQAEHVGEYRRLIEDVQEHPTDDAVRVARALPGTKYYVNAEYIRQLWLKIDVELKKVFDQTG